MATNLDNPVIDNHSLVLFDGVCHFCNNSVNFIIDRDPKKKFVFAPLQSQVAKEKLMQMGVFNTEIDSIILIQNNNIYKRSNAALKIAKQLNGFWPVFYVFILVPAYIRDILYNFIAKNRYNWFGKMDVCHLPTAEARERFL